jgi:hypothetical protein
MQPAITNTFVTSAMGHAPDGTLGLIFMLPSCGALGVLSMLPSHTHLTNHHGGSLCHQNRNPRPLPKMICRGPASHPSNGERGAAQWTRGSLQWAFGMRATSTHQQLSCSECRSNFLHHGSPWTTSRWARKLDKRGDVKPFQMNGNKGSAVLTGRMRFLISHHRVLFPKCAAAELKCHLCNVTRLDKSNGSIRALKQLEPKMTAG